MLHNHKLGCFFPARSPWTSARHLLNPPSARILHYMGVSSGRDHMHWENKDSSTGRFVHKLIWGQFLLKVPNI